MRVGSGYDVHRFGPGDRVRLGGVTIPHTHGVVAHSDGDVLLHALMDALLGAAALGDIGRHFPPADARFRGADSRQLLREVGRLVAAQGFGVANCDLTLVAEAPHIAAHREVDGREHRRRPRDRTRAGKREGDDRRGARRPGPG